MSSISALDNMNSIVKKRPLDINIETTNFCPLKCVFCPNRKVERTTQIMPMELFDKICKDYYDLGGGAIGISSMQADIFSDNLLLKRLETLRKYSDKFYVYTTTNLVTSSKLNDVELKDFLETFDFLVISIGGADKEEYKKLYGVDAFETVENQLKRFRKIINDNDINIRIDIAIRTHQKEKLIDSDNIKKLQKLFKITDIKDEFFSWYGHIKQNELPDGAKLINIDNSKKTNDCVVPFATLSITPSGKVIGCGCIDWEDNYVIGDIKTQTIEQVWQSPKAIEFREGFSNAKLPFICKDCGLYIEKNQCFSKPKLTHYKVTDGLYYN